MQNFKKTLISKTPTTPQEVVTKGYAKKLIGESGGNSGSNTNIIDINMVFAIVNDDTIITCNKTISEILELEKSNHLRFNFTYNVLDVECTGSSEMYNPFTIKEENALLKGITFMMFCQGQFMTLISGITDGNTDSWEVVEL